MSIPRSKCLVSVSVLPISLLLLPTTPSQNCVYLSVKMICLNPDLVFENDMKQTMEGKACCQTLKSVNHKCCHIFTSFTNRISLFPRNDLYTSLARMTG